VLLLTASHVPAKLLIALLAMVLAITLHVPVILPTAVLAMK
jgi:hypothetical protein